MYNTHQKYQEPQRFVAQNEPLDNFADLANRTKVKEKGLFSEKLPHPVTILVEVKSMDDLVQIIEQDYYLNKLIMKKLEYISKNNEIFDAVCRLVEVYISVNHLNSTNAGQVKTFVLSNLNLV